MASLVSISFTSWNLTQEELRMGSIFTDLNLKLIQNEISIAALEKLNLTFNPLNPNEFIQMEAELGGKIRALQYLLDLHHHAVQPLAINTDEGN